TLRAAQPRAPGEVGCAEVEAEALVHDRRREQLRRVPLAEIVCVGAARRLSPVRSRDALVAQSPSAGVDRVVAEQDLAAAPARLRTGDVAEARAGRREGFPVELEPDRDAVTELAVPRVGGVIEPDAECLRVDGPVLVEHLADELAPQRFAARDDLPVPW